MGSIRLTILKGVSGCNDPATNAVRQYHLNSLRHSAHVDVEIIGSLRKHHLKEFDLPSRCLRGIHLGLVAHVTTNRPC